MNQEHMNQDDRDQDIRDQELRELYQEVIIDHGRRPRNFRRVEGASHCQEGFNPLCGDRLKLYLRLAPGEEAVIQDVAFLGEGCAISIASASLMTECLKGKTRSEAETLFQGFHQLVTVGGDSVHLGKLRVLAGVRAFPSRIKCATLAWHALQGALSGGELTQGVGERNQGETGPGTQGWVSTE
ncbi:MAG: SUF system NifU family Fe-S cluster assembly protein [Motiliproteus sp.]